MKIFVYWSPAILNDKLFLEIEKRLTKEPIRQIYNKTEVCIQSVPKGGQTAILESLSVGRVPSRLYLLCQESDRLHGSFKLNSLKFPRQINSDDPFILKECTVTLGPQVIEGLNCDTTKNSFKDHYFRLFNILNQDHGKNACSLTFKEFVDNYTLLIYDFTSSLNESPPHLLPLVKSGNLRVKLEFNKPATSPLNILCFLEMQSAIEIHKNGKIVVDTV